MPQKNKYADNIQDDELDLSLNNLDEVPIKEVVFLFAMKKLKKLDLSCNKLVTLPDSICSLTALTQLNLAKNRLIGLPLQFGQLSNLQSLDLQENHLIELPPSFGRLNRLNYLDLRKNPTLNDAIKISAGDCVTDKACATCAKQVVMLMHEVEQSLEIREQQERERQEKLEKERVEIERKEKAMQKEERRRKYQNDLEEKKRQEILQNQNKESVENDCANTHENSDRKSGNGLYQHEIPKSDNSFISLIGSSLIFFMFLTVFVVSAAISVTPMNQFFCKSSSQQTTTTSSSNNNAFIHKFCYLLDLTQRQLDVYLVSLRSSATLKSLVQFRDSIQRWASTNGWI